jgi:hypothetical protein
MWIVGMMVVMVRIQPMGVVGILPVLKQIGGRKLPVNTVQYR